MASTTKSVASVTSSPGSVADTRVEAISPHEYPIGAFIPTVLAVVFTIPWDILASAVKEIEPFYQMQRANGASAACSLTSDYKASISVVATMNAMSRGHFVVWGSGLLSLITLSLSPLASETVFIGFDGHCTATSGRQACSPHLSVYPLAARVIQGILTFITIITLALAIDMWHKRSGIYADPWSIAGLATLFQNRRLIEMFRQLDPSITKPTALKAALKSHRYQIAPYLEVDGESGHGIMICQSDTLSEDSDVRTSFQNGKKYAAVHMNIIEDHTVPAHHKPRRTIATILTQSGVIVIFAFLITGPEALAIVYSKTGGDTAFERFMDSDAFGVCFLFTAVGVMVKLYWNLLDDGKPSSILFTHVTIRRLTNHVTETRKQEPYRQFLHGNAQASDSILLSPHSNPFTRLFHSLRNSHYFNAYISLVAILCEPLIVALANIPFKPGLAFIAYRACTYITIAVLSMMLIGIAWMLCRKQTPAFRRPETLADMMIAQCGSRMLADFKGLSALDSRERDAVVGGWGKRYAMGTMVGVMGWRGMVLMSRILIRSLKVSAQEAREDFCCVLLSSTKMGAGLSIAHWPVNKSQN